MPDFLNYEVQLSFKDGRETTGKISHVDGHSISLDDKTYPNVQIADLKVLRLPADPPKSKNKKKSKNIENIDDAIVSVSKNDKNGEAYLAAKKESGLNSDVEDIKSSQDFDFAANLAMFDKASVFADFQKNDKANVEDRLVGQNKVGNVQKSKKQNSLREKYDHDETVIPANKQDNWNNIGLSTKRFNSPLDTSRNNSLPSLSARELYASRNHRFVFQDASSVPTASPVQVIEIERSAKELFLVDSKALTETCASNTYQLIVGNILGGSARLSNRKNHNLPPLVLLLIGNVRCSSRAFAIGRHLTNHGVRVLAYVINDCDMEDELREQYDLFERAGGKVVSVEFSMLLEILNHQLETPVELIIDALQGFEGHLLDLFYTDESLNNLRQLAAWASEPRQRSKILSLDIPSGIDGGSGTVLDPEIQFHSRHIVSMGLPITGLLHAYNNRQIGAANEEVLHYVVDVGIPNALYNTKASLRKFDKFWYCAEQNLSISVLSD